MSNNIITNEFKNLFKQSIDEILAQNALAIPCTLFYASQKIARLCGNCLFDPITKASSYRYNGTGPIAFADGQICPVCSGFGKVEESSSNSEVVHLGVIFDSKFFVGWDSSVISIPDGSMQTICSSVLLSKIKTASSLKITTNNITKGYMRAGEPQLIGLGSMDYIITNWKIE